MATSCAASCAECPISTVLGGALPPSGRVHGPDQVLSALTTFGYVMASDCEPV